MNTDYGMVIGYGEEWENLVILAESSADAVRAFAASDSDSTVPTESAAVRAAERAALVAESLRLCENVPLADGSRGSGWVPSRWARDARGQGDDWRMTGERMLGFVLDEDHQADLRDALDLAVAIDEAR